MAAVSICLHNKFGFCKHGEKCRKQHINEICKNKECNLNECERRHPKECKFFRLYKRCKFGDYCAYDHTDTKDPVLEEIKLMKNSIIALEKEMKNRNDDFNNSIRNIEKALNTLLTSSKSTFPNDTSNIKSNLAIITTNLSSTTINSESDIPQLDGHIPQFHDESDSVPPLTNLTQNECENCKKSFEIKEDLKIHTDENEWGCDDCLLCFKTKYSEDLHELEHHGDTPDSISYINNHIPETTKRLFAAGHRES